MLLTGGALIAGVVGDPIRHSLSPRIHGAWIEALGLDAAYVPLHPMEGGFRRLVDGLRASTFRGLSVTLPFKEEALALADEADELSKRSGASNLLLFRNDGSLEARNTDGPGMLRALKVQAPQLDLQAAPAVVLGAGGAARGAAAALIAAEVPELRLVNRTLRRAAGLAGTFPRTRAFELSEAGRAFDGAGLIVNATSAGLNGQDDLDLPLDRLPAFAVVMDMVYKPLRTSLLRRATARGLTTVDGLEMLIGTATPAFEAFFGLPPPSTVDVRSLCLAALGEKD